MEQVVDKAYLLSLREYYSVLAKFPAFITSYLTEKAKSQFCYTTSLKYKGYYTLRSSCDNPFYDGAYYVTPDGTVVYKELDAAYSGLRCGLNYFYDPNCKLAKSCVYQKKSTKILKHVGKYEKVSSIAPIVTTSKGVQYIWLNKEECEAGLDKTMRLFMLSIEAKACPFGKRQNKINYQNANELRSQAELVTKEGMSEEEWSMVVPVVINHDSLFDYVEPVIDYMKVEILIYRMQKGELNENQFKFECVKIIDSCETEEQINDVVEYMQNRFGIVQTSEQMKLEEEQSLKKSKSQTTENVMAKMEKLESFNCDYQTTQSPTSEEDEDEV